MMLSKDRTDGAELGDIPRAADMVVDEAYTGISAAVRRSQTPTASADRSAGEQESAVQSRGVSQPQQEEFPVEPETSVMQSIEDVTEELRKMDEREANMEEHLQVYSDVIGLRKELVVVKNDEARARRQREMGFEAVNRECPEIEASANSLEEEVQKSLLQHIWANGCAKDSSIQEDDTSRWIKIDTEDLKDRLRKCKDRLDAANKEADRLYRIQEEKINLNTDERDRQKKLMEGDVKEEMDNLAERRNRLRQLDRDQHFHIKRGTHVKEHQVSAQRRRDVECGRIYRNESKAFSKKLLLDNEIADLTELIKQSKRIIEDNGRNNKAVVDELKEQLRITEDNGKEVHELREVLVGEGNELKVLKQDLQRVLQYVRTRNYHSNYDD